MVDRGGRLLAHRVFYFAALTVKVAAIPLVIVMVIRRDLPLILGLAYVIVLPLVISDVLALVLSFTDPSVVPRKTGYAWQVQGFLMLSRRRRGHNEAPIIGQPVDGKSDKAEIDLGDSVSRTSGLAAPEPSQSTPASRTRAVVLGIAGLIVGGFLMAIGIAGIGSVGLVAILLVGAGLGAFALGVAVILRRQSARSEDFSGLSWGEAFHEMWHDEQSMPRS